MAVTLTSSGAGIFDRIGAFAAMLRDLVSIQGGTATTNVLSAASWQTRGNTLATYGALSPNVLPELSGHWTAISNWRSSQAAPFQSLGALLQAIVIRQVDLDASLSSKDLTSALTELARQMVASADSVQQSTVSLGAQTAVGTPTGNPVFVGSTKNAKGVTLQTPFAETIHVTVFGDAYAGTGTARQEPVVARGAAAAPSVYDYRWPAGSGASASFTLTDSQLSNAGNNALTNGSWATVTNSNLGDNWAALTGATGTNIFAGGSGYSGSTSIQFTGDGGGTLAAVTQKFNTTPTTGVGTGGTPYQLRPLTQYCLNGWVKCSATPAAGVLEFSLIDGSNTITTDYNGANNSFTKSLTAVSTSWVNFNGVFRTGYSIPSTCKLRVRYSTAIDNSKSSFVSDLALTPMSQMYAGGPFFAGFAGATQPVTNDSWTFSLTNTFGVMAQWLERFFSLRSLNIQFPFSGSPTIPDSLATT